MSKDKLQYDVIVVGAGMAGSTAAAIAAREGLNVAVIERGVLLDHDVVHHKEVRRVDGPAAVPGGVLCQ